MWPPSLNGCLPPLQTVEVGEVLQRFTASDDDLGVNSALEYSLEQLRPNGDSEVRLGHTPPIHRESHFQDSFSVHRYTGDLAVTQSLTLGFEYILTITATVRALLSGPHSALLPSHCRMKENQPSASASTYPSESTQFPRHLTRPCTRLSCWSSLMR